MAHWCLNDERVTVTDEYWLRDGYGIELVKVCSRCEDVKLARYRPDIQTRYETDEQVEEELY